MKQIKLKEGNKGFLNLPQFETIWSVTPVTELTIGSAEVAASIALWASFFPAYSHITHFLTAMCPQTTAS